MADQPEHWTDRPPTAEQYEARAEGDPPPPRDLDELTVELDLIPGNRQVALDLAVQLEVARIRCGFGPGDYDTMEAVTLDAEALLAWLEAGDE